MSATRMWATLSQEWAAVQTVVGPTINPQAFLYPAMNATGTQALEVQGILDIPASQFIAYQSHPAWMTAAIQLFVRRLDRGPEGIFTVESVNDQVDVFNVTGLDPQQEATLITRLATQPLATAYLAPPAPAKTATPRPFRQPINPITNHFRLPVSIAGKLSPSMRAGSGCETPCPPLAEYHPGSPAVFTYQVAPPLPTKGMVNGIYWVGVYRTVAAARAENLRAMDMIETPGAGNPTGDPYWLEEPGSPALPIAAPVASNEWLRGREITINGMRDCYAIAGVRYNNILMLAQVDNYNSVTPPGYVYCQTSYKWSTRVLAALYGRAQTFTGR